MVLKMAGVLFRAVKSAILFGYGLFILFVYGFMQIRSGSFFKKSSEKEKLELYLGMFCYDSIHFTRSIHIPYPINTKRKSH